MTDERRHARRAGFPGKTMCGKDILRDGSLKFGKNRKGCNCDDCDAAIARSAAERERKKASNEKAKALRRTTERKWR